MSLPPFPHTTVLDHQDLPLYLYCVMAEMTPTYCYADPDNIPLVVMYFVRINSNFRFLILVTPSKKQRAVSLAHQINGVGKGTEGATEQLKKVGDAVTQGSRKKPDWLAALGEVQNLMAPETPGTARFVKMDVHAKAHKINQQDAEDSECLPGVSDLDEPLSDKKQVGNHSNHYSNLKGGDKDKERKGDG
ncbi:hypothetical protein L210DRAFT_935054 [Boletus edulis BED1]|uniref:Uncharacterized protein n=1 Tax=Boletus edulis BED1 TaxID=1328754 RepID=A0AAD4GLK4_BOLED|nr:hypothetical protein L210DRAFT_935054 [Boletus edulis BED1]